MIDDIDSLAVVKLLRCLLIISLSHRTALTDSHLGDFWQVSYMILQRVSPVTHSVGNCVKRVVVIVSSVIFFKTPVSPINSIGKSWLLPSSVCEIRMSNTSWCIKILLLVHTWT